MSEIVILTGIPARPTPGTLSPERDLERVWEASAETHRLTTKRGVDRMTEETGRDKAGVTPWTPKGVGSHIDS